MAREGRVEFRAFRGTHRSAVYRSHAIDRAALGRIVDAATAELLPTVSHIVIEGTSRYDPRAARRIATEITQLRSAVVLLDLDHDLAAIARVANWCAHARETAWLTIRVL